MSVGVLLALFDNTFLDRGLMQILVGSDEKVIEDSMDALVSFLSDYVLVCMVGVMPDEESSTKCRACIREGLAELIETFDLLTIAMAAAAELREFVFEHGTTPSTPDSNPDGPWRVSSFRASSAVSNMLTRCSYQVGRRR
jgi:hypothetical protein